MNNIHLFARQKCETFLESARDFRNSSLVFMKHNFNFLFIVPEEVVLKFIAADN